MLTAAITAAIGWILHQFGIQPGLYLGFVAAGVKIIIVLVGLTLGAKMVKKARAKQVAEAAGGPPNAGTPADGPPDPTPGR